VPAEAKKAAELDASRNGRPPNRTVVLRQASAIKPEPVSWLWRPLIAFAALTLMAGRQGLGKTLFAVDLVARASRGKLDGDHGGQPATCLFATGEDDLASVLVPRLIAADADLSRVQFVTAELAGREDALRLPEDADRLSDQAQAVGAALLVVDPLSAFLEGHVDAHKDADVRRGLAPLARLSMERKLAIFAVSHLNKSMSSDPFLRVSGSGAFTAAPRSVLVFGPDPGDPDGELGARRVLAHPKSNLGPRSPSLAWRIEPCQVEGERGKSIETARIVGEGETAHTAGDLLGAPMDAEERSARADAVEFLRAILDDAPIRSVELKRAARDAGISDRTLRRAQDELAIKPEQKADGWYWALPREGEK
jgi:hypothetical protein